VSNILIFIQITIEYLTFNYDCFRDWRPFDCSTNSNSFNNTKRQLYEYSSESTELKYPSGSYAPVPERFQDALISIHIRVSAPEGCASWRFKLLSGRGTD